MLEEEAVVYIMEQQHLEVQEVVEEVANTMVLKTVRQEQIIWVVVEVDADQILQIQELEALEVKVFLY